jgi:hypothetical protein
MAPKKNKTPYKSKINFAATIPLPQIKGGAKFIFVHHCRQRRNTGKYTCNYYGGDEKIY